MQTCQKESHFAMHEISAPFWKHPGSDMGAPVSGSEDLGSYKHLIRRNKSDGINLTSIIQHASADKISISWNMTCRNAKNLVSARLNSEMLQVACFLAKNLPPHLSSLGFIPRRIGFPRFFQQKSQTVDLHKKKTSSESQSCFHQLQNRADFDKHQMRHLWPQKSSSPFFLGGAEIDSPHVFVGAFGVFKTTSP